MTLVKFAIILETISYFLVTLDLIGKNRIVYFQEKLRIAIVQFKPFSFFRRHFWKILLFIGILVIVLHVIFRLNDTEPYGAEYEMKYGGQRERDDPFDPYNFITFFICFLVATVLPVLLLLIIIFEYLLDLFLSLLINCINRFELEGLMLVVGTILFLISKVISYSCG